MTWRIDRRGILATIAGASLSLTGCLHQQTRNETGEDGNREVGDIEDRRQSLIDAPEAGTSKDWTTYQFNNQNTGHYPYETPSGEIEVRWTLELDGAPLPPLVIDGTVYAVDESGTLSAIDAASGDVRRKVATDDSFELPDDIDIDYPLLPTVKAGLVFFGTGESVYCVDGETGEEIWRRDGDGGNPALITGDKLVIQGKKRGEGSAGAYIVDAASGETQTAFEPYSWYNKPSLYDDTLYFADIGGGVVGYDLETQERTFYRSIHDREFLAEAPAIDPENELLYASGNIAGSLVHCIEISSEEEVWTWWYGREESPYSLDQVDSEYKGEIEARAAPEAGVYHSISFDEDSIYIRPFPFHGEEPPGVYALDCFTGETLWHSQVQDTVRRPRGASPVVTENAVYFPRPDLTAYHKDTGEVLWRFEPDGDASFMLSPAVTEDAIYVGDTEGTLYAIQEA